MTLSFFTRRGLYASKRLRFVARTVQTFGILLGVVSLLLFWMPPPPGSPTSTELVKRFILVSGIGVAASLFLIGRAIRRREKWGAYFALIALGGSLLFGRQSLHLDPVTIIITIPTLLSIGLIATVWRELGSVRDADMIEHGSAPDPTKQLKTRNRGYGERSLK